MIPLAFDLWKIKGPPQKTETFTLISYFKSSSKFIKVHLLYLQDFHTTVWVIVFRHIKSLA